MLAERLRELIRARGPIPFRDWMEAALYDRDEGYYNREDLKRWGREGDYRTSPERSDLFAATFARYFVRLYDELQRPPEWTIVECGAGDGRFALGVLRSLAQEFPPVFEATRYFIYDVSADALRRAKQTLIEFGDRVSFGGLDDVVSVSAGIFFSNELLDSFPVHRVSADGELYVTLDSDNRFTWTVGPLSTPRLAEFLGLYSIELGAEQIIEVNLAIDDWLTDVAAKLKCGYVVTVDYGAEASELYDPLLWPQGTLRAFSRHGFIDDVLTKPGEYDLTSSVNWTQVKTTGERLGLQVVDFASQDKFLLRGGFLEEFQLRLQRAPTDADKMRLTTDAKEMLLPGGMGSSFQVLVQKRGGGGIKG